MIKLLNIVALTAVFMIFSVAANAENITVNGSGSALDMLKPLAKAYSRLNPAVTIDIGKPLGSSGAVKALASGALDLAVSSKPLKPEESAQGLSVRDYGKMPLVIVVNKSVAKTAITTRELEDIYSGRMTKWENGDQIRLVMRPDGDIDTKIIRQLSPAMDQAFSVALKRVGMVMAVTDPESNEQVARSPGGLGATGLSSLIVEKLDLKQLVFNGVQPTVKNIANNSYPMTKDVRFILKGEPSPAVKKFLEFVFSPQGRALAEKSGVFVTAQVKGGR